MSFIILQGKYPLFNISKDGNIELLDYIDLSNVRIDLNDDYSEQQPEVSKESNHKESDYDLN